ncbi:MAG: type II secretion system protein [Clostridia bacterium]|nr:type II secretion system protein [Clostridia bacterium]
MTKYKFITICPIALPIAKTRLQEDRLPLMHDERSRAANAPQRTRRGFTLIELLIVVAIVVLLAAVAIPLIGQSRDDLERTELDAVARQIFVAAQNKSTAMAALGTFDDFDTANAAQKADLPGELNAKGDYHYAGHTYLSDDYLDILPAGAIDPSVLSDQYFIEYNSKTGDIYGVFYGKEGFSYAEAVRLRDAARRKTEDGVSIGYFGGAVGAGLEAMRTKTPDFTLVNDEELYVRFAKVEAGTVYTLTVTDATAAGAEPLYFRIDKETLLGSFISSDPTLSGAVVKLPFKEDVNGDIYIVLDSLDGSSDPNGSSRRFKDNFADKDGNALIIPGHDLYLSGKAQKALDVDKKILYLESDEVSFFSNSLFDSVLREKDKNESVSIHCFRHLQNLDAASGYAPAGSFEARLTAALDWKNTARQKVTPDYKAPASLTAISNAALLVFDGQGNAIANAPLGMNKNGAQSDNTAGLFGIFTGGEGSALRRVRLSDAKLALAQSPTVTHAGMLAGRVEGGKASITDCRVYATAASGAANADCLMELPQSVRYAGGLIGWMQGGAATDCFAAVPSLTLLGDQPAEARYAGGLIGFAQNVSLERCYANTGALTCVMGGAADRLGGLLGLADGGVSAACYSAGMLDLTDAAEGCQLSGFANVAGNASFTSCYTAVTYGEGLYAPAFINPDANGQRRNMGAKVFAFADAAKGQSADGRYYLRTDGITEFCTDAGQTYGEGLSYDAMATDLVTTKLLDARWTSAGAAHTHPYSMTGAYPFPIPTDAAGADNATPYPIDHYGDWPERQGEKYLVYYERYANGRYGFFAGNGVTVDTLLDDDAYALAADGYAVLCEAADPAPALRYLTAEGFHAAALVDSAQLVNVKAADGQTLTCRAWLFPAVAQEESIAQKQAAAAPATPPQDSYFHAFSAGGYRFFANPNFAKYVFNSGDARPAQIDEPTPIAIRSARQLYRLGLPAQSVYWDRAFSQGRPIDFLTYQAQYISQPIGNATHPFTGIFDGNRHVINSLNVVPDASIADASHAGMFGLCTTTARLTRIRLQNPSVSGGTGYAGILAGRLSDATERANSSKYMASDCYVFAKDTTENIFIGSTGQYGGCTLRTPADAVGGFAGAIENSSVCDSLVSPTLMELENASLAGGFAGTLLGAQTEIAQCYANTKLLTAGNAGAVGGFAGESTAASVKGAYALGKLSVKSGNAAGFILRNNTVSCSDCYALCTYNQVDDADKRLYQTQGYGFSATAERYLANCYYWGTAGLTDSTLGTRLTYDAMRELGSTGVTVTHALDTQRFVHPMGSHTYPYELGGAYPFAFLILSENYTSRTGSNVMPHYGDWPAATGSYLAYYERYVSSDGKISYGYYTTAFNQLDDAEGRDKQLEITDDGYAILTTETITQVTFGRQQTDGDGEAYYNELDLKTQTDHGTCSIGGVDYKVYRFRHSYDSDTIMGMGYGQKLAETIKIDDAGGNSDQNMRHSFYYRIGIDGAVYYFNPCFAKTVVPTAALTPAGSVSVRTARQLKALADGRSDLFYWGWGYTDAAHEGTYRRSDAIVQFLQGHDIDGQSSTITPIGDAQHCFRNSYDGGCYVIRDLGVQGGSQNTGLFGVNVGTLSNIFFVAGQNGNTIRASGDRAGGLVGVNGKNTMGDTRTGSISNCFTAGFDIDTSGMNGGFVAINEGEIRNCGAVLYTRGSAGGSIRDGESGGFVCTNSGSIEYCFAITTNTFQNKNAQAGFVKSNSSRITNAYCASYYDVSGQEGYLPFGIDNSGCFAYDTKTNAEIMAAFEPYKVDAAHSHPFDTGLAGTASPWPSFVHDHNGTPIFFGNWITP